MLRVMDLLDETMDQTFSSTIALLALMDTKAYKKEIPSSSRSHKVKRAPKPLM